MRHLSQRQTSAFFSFNSYPGAQGSPCRGSSRLTQVPNTETCSSSGTGVSVVCRGVHGRPRSPVDSGRGEGPPGGTYRRPCSQVNQQSTSRDPSGSTSLSVTRRLGPSLPLSGTVTGTRHPRPVRIRLVTPLLFRFDVGVRTDGLSLRTHVGRRRCRTRCTSTHRPVEREE